jgi:hypothetical protein
MSVENLSQEAITALANFADTILKSPKRMEVLGIAKEVIPNYRHAELDINDRFVAQETSSNKKIDELTGELRAERLDRARTEKKRELQALGYDIVAVEKVMTDNGISNYEAAMKVMKAESMLAAPTPGHHKGATHMPSDMKEISKNPTQWARDKAAEILNEMQAARPAA